ncbi:hypothetical protein ACFSTA_01525 [Ornithinibacillus salinisoli]|uniref:Uncharacterized protein n=1 Tax=Ornithinibacillus salinisoli TaxID=1848459 RepID=A0ABW4VUP1_9BACI
MFALIPLLLLLILAFLLLFIFIKRNKVSGIKFMLLGISIILIGGFIAVDEDLNLWGSEYLIVFTGLIFSIAGFSKNS